MGNVIYAPPELFVDWSMETRQIHLSFLERSDWVISSKTLVTHVCSE